MTRVTLDDDAISLALKFNENQDFDEREIRDLRRALELAVDSHWDQDMCVAIAEFQAKAGLEVDGMVGCDSLETMLRALSDSVELESSLGPLAGPDLGELDFAGRMALTVAKAEEDWREGTAESDLSRTGRLAQIFKDSGWSRYGVDLNRKGKAKDWCGMAVASWLYRAGMNRAHRKSFFATSNVLSFYTYSRAGVTHRTMKQVEVGDRWMLLEDYHRVKSSVRSWMDAESIRSAALDTLDFRPGDVVLINHYGRTNGAHHVAMVRSWNAPVLETIEGNASGLGPNEKKRRQASVTNLRDLSEKKSLKKIFGVGRASLCDFEDLTYR